MKLAIAYFAYTKRWVAYQKNEIVLFRILNFIKNPRLVLTLILISFIATTVSISFRIFLKAYLPLGLGYYNTAIYSLVLLILTSLLIVWLLVISNIRFTYKGLLIPILLALNFFVSLKVGHAYTIKGTTAFYNLNNEKFEELKRIMKKENIKTITKIPFERDFIIKSKSDQELSNDKIIELSNQLGFIRAKREESISLVYEFSMWGGYGLYLTNGKPIKIKRSKWGETVTNYTQLDTNVCYYEYE